MRMVIAKLSVFAIYTVFLHSAARAQSPLDDVLADLRAERVAEGSSALGHLVSEYLGIHKVDASAYCDGAAVGGGWIKDVVGQHCDQAEYMIRPDGAIIHQNRPGTAGSFCFFNGPAGPGQAHWPSTIVIRGNGINDSPRSPRCAEVALDQSFVLADVPGNAWWLTAFGEPSRRQKELALDTALAALHALTETPGDSVTTYKLVVQAVISAQRLAAPRHIAIPLFAGAVPSVRGAASMTILKAGSSHPEGSSLPGEQSIQAFIYNLASPHGDPATSDTAVILKGEQVKEATALSETIAALFVLGGRTVATIAATEAAAAPTAKQEPCTHLTPEFERLTALKAKLPAPLTPDDQLDLLAFDNARVVDDYCKKPGVDPIFRVMAAANAASWRSKLRSNGPAALPDALREFVKLRSPPLESFLPTQDQPWAPFSSRVLRSPLEAGYVYRIRVCRGIECKADSPAELIRSDYAFKTRPSHRIISVGTELAWNSDLKNAPRAGYAFEQADGTTGPGLYELRGREDKAADAITFSTLLLFYPTAGHLLTKPSRRMSHLLAERWCLAAGPTITQGTQAKLFKQWNVRLGYELPFAPGVLVTTGVSFRAVDVPVDYRIGERLWAEARPSARSASKWGPVFSIGLTIDLNILRDVLKVTGDALASKEGE